MLEAQGFLSITVNPTYSTLKLVGLVKSQASSRGRQRSGGSGAGGTRHLGTSVMLGCIADQNNLK